MSHLQVSYSRHLEINSGKADSIRPSIEASNLCEQSQPRKQFFSRGANPPIVGQELLLNIAFLIDDDNRWSRNVTSGWVTSNVTKPEGVNHLQLRICQQWKSKSLRQHLIFHFSSRTGAYSDQYSSFIIKFADFCLQTLQL